MPLPIIRMNPLPTLLLLLLALAGCPLAGEWPAKSADASGTTASSSTTTASTSSASTSETGSGGTDSESDGGTGAPTTGGASCMPSACYDECNTCMADEGCAALQESVKCTGQQCVNDWLCELGTDPESAGYFGEWAKCRIENYAPSCTLQACGESVDCVDLFGCMLGCGNAVCDPTCVDDCKALHPDGVGPWEAWESCVNTSPGLMTQ